MTWQIGAKMKYNIIFYEKENHVSQVWNFLETLRLKAQKSNKTPKKEIKKAKAERDDYLKRKEHSNL